MKIHIIHHEADVTRRRGGTRYVAFCGAIVKPGNANRVGGPDSCTTCVTKQNADNAEPRTVDTEHAA